MRCIGVSGSDNKSINSVPADEKGLSLATKAAAAAAGSERAALAYVPLRRRSVGEGQATVIEDGVYERFAIQLLERLRTRGL
jgi:hypothetical protein